MLQNKTIFLLLLLLASSVQCSRIQCPLVQPLPYCECTMSDGKHTADVDCQGLASLQNLTLVTRLLLDTPVNHLFLANSNIGHISSETFRGNHIKRLEISSTRLARLSDNGGPAFLGLENNLKELVLRYCGLTSDMALNVFSKLNSLNSLDLSFNPLVSISDEMFSNLPAHFHELYLKNCSLKYIGPEAFTKINGLVVLDLSENSIVHLSRTMLPAPASHLQYLYFSYNNIKDIPENFFKDMNVLSTVYVDNNRLNRLPQSVWEILWKNTLKTIDLLGNDIKCEQNLCWLTFLESPFVRGSCADPDELRGRRFITLWPWEVQCNESYYHGEMTLPRKPLY